MQRGARPNLLRQPDEGNRLCDNGIATAQPDSRAKRTKRKQGLGQKKKRGLAAAAGRRRSALLPPAPALAGGVQHARGAALREAGAEPRAEEPLVHPQLGRPVQRGGGGGGEAPFFLAINEKVK